MKRSSSRGPKKPAKPPSPRELAEQFDELKRLRKRVKRLEQMIVKIALKHLGKPTDAARDPRRNQPP
jgi:hypothetical protein